MEDNTFYYIDVNGNPTPFTEYTDNFVTWGPNRPSVFAFFGTWDDSQQISTICARAVDILGYLNWDDEMYVSSQHTDNGSSIYTVPFSNIYHILDDYNTANNLEYNAFILKSQATLKFEVDNFPSILPGEISWEPDSQQAYPGRQKIKYEYEHFKISEGITIGEVSISCNSFYVEVIDQGQGPSISIYDSADGITKTPVGHYTNRLAVLSNEIGMADPGKFKIIAFEGYELISGTHTLSLNIGVRVDVFNGSIEGDLIISGESLSVGTKIIIDTQNVTGVYSIYITTANNIDITEDCIILYENINDVLVPVLYMPDIDITLNVGYTLNIQCNPTNGGTFSLIVMDTPTNYSDNLIVKAGDSVQITPTAAIGYTQNIMEMCVCDNPFGQMIIDQSFTMPSNNVLIVINFDQIILPSYQISTNVNANGSNSEISTQPSGFAIEGETVIVTVLPEQNFVLYSLTYTYSNNSPITIELDEDDNYSFTMPAANVTVNAEFLRVYAISTSSNSYGEIYAPSYAVGGTTITVSIDNVTSGYLLSELSYTCSSLSLIQVPIEIDANDEYTFTMPLGDVVINAVFSCIHQININSVQNGTITVSPNSAIVGTTITVGCLPNTGYVLNHLEYKETGNSGFSPVTIEQTNDVYSFIMPDFDITIYATFIQPVQSHTLTLYNVHFGDNNATVCSLKANGVSNSTQLIPENTDVALTYNIEDDAFSFNEFNVYQGGEQITLNNNHFTMPNTDIIVRASVYKKLINVDPTIINAQITFTFKGKSITLDCPYSIYGRHLDIENPINS